MIICAPAGSSLISSPKSTRLLRAYLRRNGNYRSNALLHSAYLVNGEPAAATVWLLDLASVAPDPGAVLADVVEAPWIPVAQRAPIYQRIVGSQAGNSGEAGGLGERRYGTKPAFVAGAMGEVPGQDKTVHGSGRRDCFALQTDPPGGSRGPRSTGNTSCGANKEPKLKNRRLSSRPADRACV